MAHGTTIGPYQVVRELGRGGMGVVYLAHDTRLDRQVAMKALPEHLSNDADRLARFQREARVLASLNHPSIGAIYGLEEAAGHQYLILEYVDGETLEARLTRGAMPIDEALEVARHITEALEAAHEKGVIHRDLKPGNVMITADGSVKVLDFGLARSADSAPSTTGGTAPADSPTIPSPSPLHSPSIPGAIMGTAGYMSPEQARGKHVDKRSDIFSFGCLLYEMLTGAQPFAGETVTDSLGAILHREPDWTALPPGAPQRIRELLANCLVKDRKNRLHDIGDARIVLERAFEGHEPTGQAAASSGGWLAWPVIAVTATLLFMGAALGWWLAVRGWNSNSQSPMIVRFDLEPPSGYTLPPLGEGFPALCLSPAGDKIVFGAEAEGTLRLFMRDVSEAEAKLIPGTDGALAPFFSPDGRWLGFFAGGRMMKMPMAGGPALTICEASEAPAVWLEDGSIIFSAFEGVWRVSNGGGKPMLLAAAGPDIRTADGSVPVLGVNRVEAVPGAGYVLASAWDGDTLQSYSVVAVSLTDGAMRPVIKNATDARFVAPDRLVFLRESSLMVAPFDPVRGVATGEAMQVVETLRNTRWADAAYWAASPNGVLAYAPGGRMGPGRRLVRVDASGKSTPLMDGVDAIVGGIAVSPDGRNVAVVTLRQRIELWVYNLERGSFTLVNAEGESWSPVWTPDSAALIFTRAVPGRPQEVVRKAVHIGGASSAEPIGITSEGDFYPSSISPDGAILLLSKQPTMTDQKEKFVSFRMDHGAAGAVGGEVESISSPITDEADPLLSPDGTLLAYNANESGRYEVYVRAFGQKGPRLQASLAGGRRPRWARDGKRLFFLDRHDGMYAVEVDTQDGLRVSPPTRLFDTAGIATTALWGAYDALPDGSFVMVEPAAWELQPARLRVVLNWTEELRRLTTPSAKP